MNKKTDQPLASLGQTLGKADFTQRPMSLRKFLEPFDHNSLTDAEAGEKYALYKAGFAKQQLEDVFEKHKNSAWFREKYHPDVRLNPEINVKLYKRRLEIFMELHSRGAFSDVVLHSGNEASIIKLLDTVAVKLAGGSDDDVRYLDEFSYPNIKRKKTANVPSNLESGFVRNSSKSGLETVVASDNAKTVDPNECSDSEIPSSQQSGSKQRKQSFREKNYLSTEPDQKRNNRSRASNQSLHRSASGSSSNSRTSSSSNGEGSSSSSESGERSVNNSSRSSSSSSSCGRSRSSSQTGSSSRSSDSAASRNKRMVAHDVDYNATGVSKMGSSHRVDNTGRLLGTRSTNDDSRLGLVDRENLRRSSRSLLKGHSVGNANSNSILNSGSHQLEASESDPTILPPDLSSVQPRPVHHTSVLYFPHIPLDVYQKDLITLLSTSPHFIRLAVLDPCIMPVSDKLRSNSEAVFDPNDESSRLGIALRRVGWASFIAQVRNEVDALIEVDLESIRAQLIGQASEAQAPEDLLNCLRLSRVIADPMGLSPTDRVKSSGTVLSNLLNHCPSRVYSKGFLRRHLVLAARLTDELDKARGLWASDEGTCRIGTVLDETDISAKPMDIRSGSVSSEVNSEACNQEALSVSVKGIIDPGEDLVCAANILNTVVSRNPLLTGLTDCLVDEGNAEEELLLSGGFQAGFSVPEAPVPVALGTTALSADNTEMLQMLDRLILYLRIVHSVDFYAPALYVNEDAMPHPCHLIHVRPGKVQLQKALARPPQRNEQSLNISSHQEAVFVNQLRRIVRLVRPLSATDCEKLGLRNTEDVVDAFVRANTRRKKRKTDVIWVCTLSDKKFRDPVYVKKHILNKHMEKVEAVKKDTALFFNNYLMDPMRPQLPLEPHISSKRRRSRSKTDSVLQKNVQSNEPTSTHSATSGRFQDTKHTTTGQGLQYWPAERRFPSTPLQLFNRDHGPPGIMSAARPYIRMPYLQSRLPFHVQRGRYPNYGSNYPGARQGFQRRPYVDLDAP